MKIFRHPLSLGALVLASCWVAYMLGKGTRSEAWGKNLSREIEARETRVSFELVRSDRERTCILQDELDGLVTAGEFRAALDRLQFQADKTEENRLLSIFFQRWLEVSPLEALAEVRRVESLRHDIVRTSRVFENWAYENPDEAWHLLKMVFDGRQNDPASQPPFLDGVDPPEYILSLVSGLAQAEPQSTAEMLTQMKESPIRFHALDVLLQGWFSKDADAVFQWVAGLDDSSLREQVIEKTAAKAGQLDRPQEGIKWAQSLKSSTERQAALGVLTQQWASRHSLEAFQWVVQQPEDLKFQLSPPVISSLTKVKPGEAADWLNQFEGSSQIDPSVAAYAEALSSVNPTAAMDSAMAITGESFRERVLLKIAKDWSRRSPDGFRAYLEKREGLPPRVHELAR